MTSGEIGSIMATWRKRKATTILAKMERMKRKSENKKLSKTLLQMLYYGLR